MQDIFNTLTVFQRKDCIVKQKHHLPTKIHSQSYGFSSSHAWMWQFNREFDSLKKTWVPRHWCFQIVVLEETFESPLNCKDIKPINPKGNQTWVFFERTDAEAEVPIPWPHDKKSWLIRKDPDAGKDWRQKEKNVGKDEMVTWHHQLSGHEVEQTPGTSEWEGSLKCCGSWHHKELDMTASLNNSKWIKVKMRRCKEILYYLLNFSINLKLLKIKSVN